MLLAVAAPRLPTFRAIIKCASYPGSGASRVTEAAWASRRVRNRVADPVSRPFVQTEATTEMLRARISRVARHLGGLCRAPGQVSAPAILTGASAACDDSTPARAARSTRTAPVSNR